MRRIDPCKMSGHLPFHAVGKPDLRLHQPAHPILAVGNIAMQIDRSPCAIFSYEHLPPEIGGIGGRVAAIRTRPVLRDIPIGAASPVAGNDQSLCRRRRIQLPDQPDTFLRKVFGQLALILQSPKDDRRAVAPFFYPFGETSLEIFTECRRVEPDMRRQLRPPEDPQAVPIELIAQVVRLVRVTEGIEARRPHLLHARPDLLRGEGMAVAYAMLVSRDAVDEHWLTVQQKRMRPRGAQIGPVDTPDAVSRGDRVTAE